ncbi:hypothetical protein HYU17_03365 [Candidatus Woesearchaeota archaeon]|nr:hypothetical protein [Candidatus Woesearchaeota archaeon]
MSHLKVLLASWAAASEEKLEAKKSWSLARATLALGTPVTLLLVMKGTDVGGEAKAT